MREEMVVLRGLFFDKGFKLNVKARRVSTTSGTPTGAKMNRFNGLIFHTFQKKKQLLLTNLFQVLLEAILREAWQLLL